MTNGANVSRVIELQFPAHARYLVLPRLSLAGIARTARLDAEALTDLKLAITEACSNVVRHAYGDKLDGEVWVRIDVRSDRLLVEVTDNGAGFDPTGVRDWLAFALRDKGMGLSIIRSVTDELEVEPGAGGLGTTVRFTKLLPAEQRDGLGSTS